MITTLEDVKIEEKKEPKLNDVKQELSEDVFRPSRLRASLYLLSGLLQTVISVYFLYYVQVNALYYFYLPAYFLAGTTVTSLFILGHDCAHESFFGNKRWNSFWGHILFIPSFYPYYAWKYSHNAHHQHTNSLRAPANSIYYDNTWIPLTIKQYRILKKRYPKRAFLYRLTRTLLPLGSLLHNYNYHYNPSLYKESHRKNVYFSYAVLFTYLGFLGTALIYFTGSVYSLFHYLLIPAIFFQFWMSLYTFLHHTSEKMKFYKEENWSQYKGQILSTRNSLMPAWLSSLHFHIDYHIPHHLNIRIPSYKLVEAQEQLRVSSFKEDLSEEKFTWKEYFNAIQKCQLWDDKNEKYITFKEAGV